MTAAEMNEEILKTYTGRIMRDPRRSGFKIVVCLGIAQARGYKLRVCVWSENQEKWSKPQVRDVGELKEIELAKITAAQRRTCQHAVNHIEKNGSTVIPGKPGDPSKAGSYSSMIFVGKPWFTKAAPKPATPGVTKLADTTFTATPEGRAKLKKLNAKFWGMFGSRK